MFEFLAKILGHSGKALPYDCTVWYANGAVDHFHFWADDMREALKLCDYWMPAREAIIDDIRIVRRIGAKYVPPTRTA